jgi:hypothetical protein
MNCKRTQCQKPFTPLVGRQLYCRPECQADERRQRNNERQNRRRALESQAKPPRQIECMYCRALVTVSRFTRYQFMCASPECRAQRDREAWRPRVGPKTTRTKETAMPTPLTNTISKQLNTLRPRRTKPRGVTRRVEARTADETPAPLQPQPEPAIVARNGPQWNTLPLAPLCQPYRNQPVMARIERGLLKPCWTKDF